MGDRLRQTSTKRVAENPQSEGPLVPQTWLQRLQCKPEHPHVHIHGTPEKGDCVAGVETWLAKLRSENLHASLASSSRRHHSAEASATRQELQHRRTAQCIQEHCRASIEFLEGPRQLRERF